MTVAALTPSIHYLEDGITLAFAAPFRFLDPTHLEVRRVLADGSEAVLAHGTQWSATGGATDAGGTVTLAASSAGAKLFIRRVTPASQATDYATNDRFPADTHEAALDKLTMLEQERGVDVADLRTRALMVPLGETMGRLASASERANQFMAFGPSGDPVVTPGTDGLTGALGVALAAPTGPGLVGYKANAIGAVARSVLARLRESVSLQDFGAVGDGVTDDSAAFALALSSGKPIRIMGGDFYLNTLIDIPPGSHSWQGDGISKIVFGPAGRMQIHDNATEWHVDAVWFHSRSAYPIMDSVGTGGIFWNVEHCKFTSENSATAAHFMHICNTWGSISSCEFYLGNGHQDAIWFTASLSNFGINDCVSWGFQTRAFAYLDGADTVYGVQGVRFIGCTLLNHQNGILAKANGGTVLSVIVSACMVDSMDKPIHFDGVAHGVIVGCHIGGNDSTQSPIYLKGCGRFTMTGTAAEAYGNFYTVTPPPKIITLDGGFDIRITDCGFNLSGNTSCVNVVTPPIGYSMTGCAGVQDFILASPPQFSEDTSIATTAWATAMGRVFSGSKDASTTQALSIADCGKYIVAQPAGPITLTLPSVSAAAEWRASLYIVNFSATNSVTLAAAGGEAIRTTDLTLGWNEYIELVNDPGGGAWIPVSRGTMG